MLYYIIITIIVFLIVIYGASRIKNKYWLHHKTYNRYSIINLLKGNRIYDNEIPEINNYINFLNVNCVNIIDIGEKELIISNRININTLKEIDYSSIIQLYNLFFNEKRHKDIIYKYDINFFKYLLHNHTYPSIVCTFKKPYYIQDIDSSEIKSDFRIFGYMCKIPLFFYYNEKLYKANKSNKANIADNIMSIYFVDNIIYNPRELKEKELLEMIYTSDYRHQKDWIEIEKEIYKNNKYREKSRVNVTIYKYTNKNVSNLILPFLNYTSFFFDMKLWRNIQYKIHNSITIIKIGTQNINLLFDFIKNKCNQYFNLIIIPTFSNITYLIQKNILTFYFLLEKKHGDINETIYAIYYFRKSNKYFNNKEILHTVGTICNKKCSKELFMCGFNNIIKLHNKQSEYQAIQIDCLSNSDIIIENILLKYKPFYFENNSLIFYNYICKSLLPTQVLIMN